MNAPDSNNKATSSRNRGAHLSATEAKDIALAIGDLITNSQCDEEGRVHLNPIVKQLSDALGKPCALNNFGTKRREMMERIAVYYNKDVDVLYKTYRGGRGDGTWWVLNYLPSNSTL